MEIILSSSPGSHTTVCQVFGLHVVQTADVFRRHKRVRVHAGKETSFNSERRMKLCTRPFGFLFAGLKWVYSVYLPAQCRWYRLAWLRAKRNWVCAELNWGGRWKKGGPGAVLSCWGLKKRRFVVWWDWNPIKGFLDLNRGVFPAEYPQLKKCTSLTFPWESSFLDGEKGRMCVR